MGSLRTFMCTNFRHFNAKETVGAAAAYLEHVEGGGRIMVSLAGAASTGEIGVSLARMIRAGHVHAICCTGANLEEEYFALIGRTEYRRVDNWRALPEESDEVLAREGMNRVTDICIPESVIGRAQARLLPLWMDASRTERPRFPHEFFYELVRMGGGRKDGDVGRAESWLAAAAEVELPVFTPGFEDSSVGGIIVALEAAGRLSARKVIRSGMEQLLALVEWYRREAPGHGMGMLQLGGGIAGDFAVSVVPLLRQEFGVEEASVWSYFAQVGDSSTSYGSYSGAPPNEKITWGKVNRMTRRFMIESDAMIVAPLIFGFVLDD